MEFRRISGSRFSSGAKCFFNSSERQPLTHREGWQCARQLKENPTLVLTTDPHRHSDDQFEGLSPQIAMHAYRQDIPEAVYKSYNSYFSKCGS